MRKVTSVTPINEYELELCFDDAERRRFDVRPYMGRGIFTQLQDKAYFCQVRVFLDSIAWPNGQDFDPDHLYCESRSC